MVKKKEGCGKKKRSKLNAIARIVMITLVVLLFAFYSYFIFFMKSIPNKGVISNAILVFFALLALISCIKLYIKMPKNFPAEREGYFFLMISIFLFFLGDLLWLVDEFRSSVLPIGGFADISWNLAYFVLILSVYFFSKMFFRESNKIYYTFLILAIIAGTILGYFDIRFLVLSGDLGFGQIIQGLYVVYDILLLVMIINIGLPIIRLRSKIFFSWIILFLGLISRTVYDYIFAVMIYRGSYFPGHPVDLIYVLVYIAIVFSCVYKCKTLDGFEVKR